MNIPNRNRVRIAAQFDAICNHGTCLFACLKHHIIYLCPKAFVWKRRLMRLALGGSTLDGVAQPVRAAATSKKQALALQLHAVALSRELSLFSY